MTLIDQYISDHKHEMSALQLAEKIGVDDGHVRSRIRVLESMKTVPSISLTVEEEMFALINYIEVRKEGVMVDVAKRRLRDLNDKINKSSNGN